MVHKFAREKQVFIPLVICLDKICNNVEFVFYFLYLGNSFDRYYSSETFHCIHGIDIPDGKCVGLFSTEGDTILQVGMNCLMWMEMFLWHCAGAVVLSFITCDILQIVIFIAVLLPYNSIHRVVKTLDTHTHTQKKQNALK